MSWYSVALKLRSSTTKQVPREVVGWPGAGGLNGSSAITDSISCTSTTWICLCHVKSQTHTVPNVAVKTDGSTGSQNETMAHTLLVSFSRSPRQKKYKTSLKRGTEGSKAIFLIFKIWEISHSKFNMSNDKYTLTIREVQPLGLPSSFHAERIKCPFGSRIRPCRIRLVTCVVLSKLVQAYWV